MKLKCKDAIAHHMRWRMIFQFAIQREEAISLDKVEQVLHADRCPVGKWLASAGDTYVRTSPEYLEAINAHLQFHREMEKLSTLINSSNYLIASQFLLPKSTFTVASKRIASAIWALNSFERDSFPAFSKSETNTTVIRGDFANGT